MYIMNRKLEHLPIPWLLKSHPHPQSPRPHQKSLNTQRYPGPQKAQNILRRQTLLSLRSGVLNRGYPDAEIMNLWRFIAGMKFHPLVFRNTYPYHLADRIEELTDTS